MDWKVGCPIMVEEKNCPERASCDGGYLSKTKKQGERED